MIFAYIDSVGQWVSKVQQSLKGVMQMLCRNKAWWCWALTLVAMSCVAQPQPSADPSGQMLAAVKNWVVREQGAPADAVQVAAIDPRVQVRSCDTDLAFDLPFSTAETVRVRCGKPVWQVFVRASVGKAVPVSEKSVAWAPVNAAAASPVGRPAGLVTVPGLPSGAPGTAAAPAQDMRAVLVAAGALQRDALLDASDVKVVQMPANQLGGRVFARAPDIAHSELLRDIAAGMPIRPTDVRPIWLVKKGQIVTLSINVDSRFVVNAQLEALQDGKMGEQIRLKNLESGRIVNGVVQGPNSVSASLRGM